MNKKSEVAKTGLGSALGTKALLVFTVLVISVLLQQSASVSSALGGDTDWVLNGDCVRWNNTRGDIKVCPHTITQSGWVSVDLTSHLASAQDLTFAFGISEGLSVSKPQIFTNVSHPYTISNCTRVAVEILNNGTPESEEQKVCNPYLADNYYNDWQSVSGFSQAAYDGKTWYLRDASWNAGETKTVRAWVDVVPRSGVNKYYVFLKRASDTIAQAVSNGNYVLLDPWVNSPPTVFNETFDNGAFVNASITSLNISRGWLILRNQSFNSTIFTRNTSDDGFAGTCRNSSQDAGSVGSKANYACSNLFDGNFGNTDPAQIYGSQSPMVEPEWVVRVFPKAVWLYNLSIETYTPNSAFYMGNYSWQCADNEAALNSITPTPGGSDSAANWNYATFNVTDVGAVDPQFYTFGAVRCKSLRLHVQNQHSPDHQVYVTEIQGYQAAFNTSGQMTSILLNSTIVVDKVNATCVNTTGTETGVGMNITVMDKNFANAQTIKCNSDSAKGFENDITDITGLIYRVNFFSTHSGITPELDFLTLRIKEAAGAGSATESEGDVAIELGINSSLPSAAKYSSQQVYVRNVSNNQTLGRFDWVASYGSQRWLFNYITAGESYVRAPNLTTAVYVLEITSKTSAQITDQVSKLINATKS